MTATRPITPTSSLRDVDQGQRDRRVLRADEHGRQLVRDAVPDHGHLDAQEVGHQVQTCAQGDQEGLQLEASSVRVGASHQLEQQDGEGAGGRQATGDREIVLAHDIRVEEDEAAQEHLKQEDVPHPDVDRPPQVGAQAQGELASQGEHVGPGQVQGDREKPQGYERGGDRPFDELLGRAERCRVHQSRPPEVVPGLPARPAGRGETPGGSGESIGGPPPCGPPTCGAASLGPRPDWTWTCSHR